MLSPSDAGGSSRDTFASWSRNDRLHRGPTGGGARVASAGYVRFRPAWGRRSRTEVETEIPTTHTLGNRARFLAPRARS